MAHAWKAAQARSGGAAPLSGFVAVAESSAPSNASAQPESGTEPPGERERDEEGSDVASSNGDDD